MAGAGEFEADENIGEVGSRGEVGPDPIRDAGFAAGITSSVPSA